MTDITSGTPAVSTSSTLEQQLAVRQIAEQQRQATEETRSSVSRLKFSEDFDNFLTLLTTQLTHQDPLSPLDTHQFTNQLVQFASVEQQLHQSGMLENLVALLEGQQGATVADGLGYLGKEVAREGTNQFLLNDGDSARLQYVLPEGAQNARLEVRNASGNIVYKSNTAGLNVLDEGRRFRKGADAESFSYTLSRDVARAVVKITDSEGGLVHQEAVAATSGSATWAWDGSSSELGAQRDADGKIKQDGEGNILWRQADEGDYRFTVEGAFVQRDGEQSAEKRATFVWHGRGLDGESALAGRYSYHVTFDLPDGSKGTVKSYVSPARVVGVVSDPDAGVRLQLDTGAEVGLSEIVGLRE